MSSRSPERLGAVRVIVFMLIALLATASLFRLGPGGDYRINGTPGADNAGPPLQALVDGHFHHLLAVQPVMGLVSLLWRVPFVAVASVLHEGDGVIYPAGAAACLLPALALIGWMLRRTGSAREVLGVAIAGAVIVMGPATTNALQIGHPEELLTAVAASAAVLFARAGHRDRAAICLGLAIGSKEWALLTAPAVLLALPRGRGRALLIAGLIAAAASLPLPLLDPSAFHQADASIGPIRTVSPPSLWWLLSPGPNPVTRILPFGLRRPEAIAIPLALAALLGFLLAHWKRRRGGVEGVTIDPLALLALSGLLRCICDPANLGYYLVAAIVPLVVWEAAALRRLPILSVLACAVQSMCVAGTSMIPGNLVPRPIDLHEVGLFLTTAVLLAGYLMLRVFGPLRLRRVPAPSIAVPVPEALVAVN